PHVRHAYAKYGATLERLRNQEKTPEPTRRAQQLAVVANRREARLAGQTSRLHRVLSLEPLLGIGVLVCVGLLNVFGGTLVPVGATQPAPPPTGPFHTTVQTFDQ